MQQLVLGASDTPWERQYIHSLNNESGSFNRCLFDALHTISLLFPLSLCPRQSSFLVSKSLDYSSPSPLRCWMYTFYIHRACGQRGTEERRISVDLHPYSCPKDYVRSQVLTVSHTGNIYKKEEVFLPDHASASNTTGNHLLSSLIPKIF